MAEPISKEPSGGARQPGEFLAVGRVLRPHGVRGALLVDPYSAVIERLGAESEVFLGDPPERRVVRSLRPHRRRFLLFLDACSDRDTAETFKGQEVRLRFDDVEPLPEGVYYHWQIVGLQVVSETGERLGTVQQILETGANDVYIVRDEEGGELLLPAIESVIQDVDLDQGRLRVRLLPGLRP